MADELPLPRLFWDHTTDSFTKNQPRKRVRGSSPPPPSSDPPIFSSDDDPSCENYTQERQKKKFRGPWYQQRPASDLGSDPPHEAPKRCKRPFERQFDSGVFMGSDSTDLEVILDYLEPQNAFLSPRNLQKSYVPLSAEDLACQQIELCLEEGNESIDLSSRGLTKVSNAMLRPLATFTRVPPVTEGVFSRLEPKLKIFLASNQLKTLPSELFNLDHLRVLSLRNNQIQELPPRVGHFTNLQELNLSQNRLRYLPFEILDLFSEGSRLESLNLHPNIFHEPLLPPYVIKPAQETQHRIGFRTNENLRPRRGALCCVAGHEEQRSWNRKWRVQYQASTEVRFLDINGSLVKGPTFISIVPPSSQSTPYTLPVASVDYIPKPPLPRGNIISRAPSLVEVALTASSKTSKLPSSAFCLTDEGLPHLQELISLALMKKESGGTLCTICRRSFIVARTEWIEWWEMAKVLDHSSSSAAPFTQIETERDVLERMVPLMRRGCSWRCVPSNFRTRADWMMEK